MTHYDSSMSHSMEMVGIIPNLSSNTSAQPYKYGGKELTTTNGLNEYDFGARQYWQAVPGFTSIDPCAGDYTWLSPYLYCCNNPVNAIDPDGSIVITLNSQAQQNINHTLSEEESKYLVFNNGILDQTLLNTCESESSNIIALKELANSDDLYIVGTSASYICNGKRIEFEDSPTKGTVGTTLIPDLGEEPSPDNKVYVYTSNKLSNADQVENTAHELYGHAYFNALRNKGINVNPLHHYSNVSEMIEIDPEFWPVFIFARMDTNRLLNAQIKRVTQMARDNYKKRH